MVLLPLLTHRVGVFSGLHADGHVTWKKCKSLGLKLLSDSAILVMNLGTTAGSGFRFNAVVLVVVVIVVVIIVDAVFASFLSVVCSLCVFLLVFVFLPLIVALCITWERVTAISWFSFGGT